MVKLLIGLGVAMLLLNPLSGVYLMDVTLDGWSIAMREAGWIVTCLFAVVSVFYMGSVWARITAQDKKKQAKGISKAKKSRNKRDGMVYEQL